LAGHTGEVLHLHASVCKRMQAYRRREIRQLLAILCSTKRLAQGRPMMVW
jgi:hypothetical protein